MGFAEGREGYGGKRITVPFFSFVKQRPGRTWGSDASLAAEGGYVRKLGCTGDSTFRKRCKNER